MAEALLKKALAAAVIHDVSVRSCGTAVSPLYKVPPPVVALMSAENIDVLGHIPAQINNKLIKWADIVLAMDDYHTQYLEAIAPGQKSKVFLFKEYVSAEGQKQIRDPMGRPSHVYAETAAELKKCVDMMIKKIQNDRKIE
jgi:protein-tyrosine-phosphatase